MRKLATYQGTIENECATVPSDAGIPEKMITNILVPDAETASERYIASPHLADPQQASDFQKLVIEGATKTACDPDVFNK
jgi:hypothetical protein